MKTLLLLCLVISFAVPGCVLVRRATYPKPRIVVVSPPPAPLNEVSIQFSGGSIRGWLNESVPSNDSTPIVLYLHGNGENLQTMLRNRVFGEFAKMKVHCLAIDYPGYGASSGNASEKTIVESAESSIVWMIKKYPSNPKFIAGFSMGAAVGVQIGVKYSPYLQGLILIAPWTSLDSVAVIHYPRWLVSLVLNDHYNSILHISDIEIPVLISHGDMDRTIPVAQGKKMADACTHLKRYQIVKGADHHDIIVRSKLWEEIANFISFPEIEAD